jgi:hypothetical protein
MTAKASFAADLAEAHESGDPAAIAMAMEAIIRSQRRDEAAPRPAPKI